MTRWWFQISFNVHPDPRENDPISRAYSSDGLVQPTAKNGGLMIYFLAIILILPITLMNLVGWPKREQMMGTDDGTAAIILKLAFFHDIQS